jgi:CDP-6-deoxy-D-xylo-4-hexulose-3-dehydrase
MQTAITESDKKALIDFIESSDRYTCGNMVKQFEDAWSEWLGSKYSLYVTSGSTANLLLMSAVKELYEIPQRFQSSRTRMHMGDKCISGISSWSRTCIL